MNADHAPSRAANIAAWLLQLIAAAFFLMAAFGKLAGVPEMIALFDAIGLGQWLRYVTAAVEVIGAVMLLWPRTVHYGALLLLATMACAILVHLFVLKNSPMMAVVAFAILALILWLRRHALPLKRRA